MGQQQFLLIVLGIIVVGFTVLVGMTLADTHNTSANRDAVMSDLIRLSSMARAHYLRPAILGGGGHTFSNFNIPAKIAENGHGKYEQIHASHNPNHIHFLGTGIAIGENDTDPISIEIRITMDEVRVTEHN